MGSQTGRLGKVTALLLFIAYIAFLSYLTFFDKFFGRGIVHRSLNLVPFKTILLFLCDSHSLKAMIINIFGNMAAFVPMGFLPPIIFRKVGDFKKIIIMVFICSASVEILQYASAVGAADIDDLILNLAGGAAGYAFYKLGRRLLHASG